MLKLLDYPTIIWIQEAFCSWLLKSIKVTCWLRAGWLILKAVHSSCETHKTMVVFGWSCRSKRPAGGVTPTWPSVCVSPCGCLPSWSPTPSSPPPSSTRAAASPSFSSSPSQSSFCPLLSSWSLRYASCGPWWTIDSCSKAGEVQTTLWSSSSDS